MALSSYPDDPGLIGESRLQNWTVIGSGGFGQIFKARHVLWGWDVAIKLLHHDDGSRSDQLLLHEADLMRQGGSPYVIRVLGVFRGRVPSSISSIQLGLVMEFMERGSLASLQDTLNSPLPRALVFRLAHQVAMGMNYLHSLSPPILHLDLKPSNVLLDTSINVKLTDFGLAKFYRSVTRASTRDSGEEGGTINYMPPEAFDLSYRPTCASDVYSYGILLWSIATGEQPYANAIASIVRLRIPKGDRPSLIEIDRGQAHAGLEDLVKLMERCWHPEAAKRPPFPECTAATEALYEKHSHAINDAIHQVLVKLDQRRDERITECVTMIHTTQALASPNGKAGKVSNHVLTGPPPTQETAAGLTVNQRDKHIIKGQTSFQPIGSLLAAPTHSSPNHKVITADQKQKSPSSPVPEYRSPHPPFRVRPRPTEHYQRQFSNPETTGHRSHSASGVSIIMSNVVGLQIGDNNTMHVNEASTRGVNERRRHPTAPPSASVPTTSHKPESPTQKPKPKNT